MAVLNRLRLDQDETQHNWLGTRAQLSKIDFDFLRFIFSIVLFSSSARYLGFILDPVLSLSDIGLSIVYLALVSTIHANSVPPFHPPFTPCAGYHDFGSCFELRQR